jgi:DNA repair photolyase
MKRFSKHAEPWGDFVDVKINAPDLLKTEINKKKRGSIWVSGVCDPYQPLEAKYMLTRKCLEILKQYDWPVIIQTRSNLVTRDIDIIKEIKNIEVGFSITTVDDNIRKLFEPDAPSIEERLEALDELHSSGIKTFVMIAPILPGAEHLGKNLAGKVGFILLDRMNYNHSGWIYIKYKLQDKLSDKFFKQTARNIANECIKSGIECRLVF